MTNTAGAVVWRARNLAYHREQTVNNSNFGSLGLSFPGQYLDAESGMAYNWHRVYDPSSGRYTQSDPIGLAGGLNTFAYAGGNPVNRADPSGLETVGPWTYPAGNQRDSYYRSLGAVRGPDYLQFSLSLYVFNVSTYVSRSGRAYGSVGVIRGYPFSGVGWSLDAGILVNACDSPDQRKDMTESFLQGLAYSGGVHALIGGGAAYSPGSGSAVFFGIGGGISSNPFSPGGDVSPGMMGYSTGLEIPFGW